MILIILLVAWVLCSVPLALALGRGLAVTDAIEREAKTERRAA